MKRTGLSKVLYLKLFSKPAQDREVYRQIQKLRANSVVELGVGSCVRSKRIIAGLLRYHPISEVHYTGIDLFESRPEPGTGMALKRAHQVLAETGVSVRLIPGDPYSALARSANALTGTDLIVIDEIQNAASLAPAWFYIPRMIHDRSVVLLATAGREAKFRVVTASEVADLASEASRSRRRAA